MSLIDIISLSSDKQAVVLDIGHAYTKVGFAGECSPRHIVPSKVPRVTSNKLEYVDLFAEHISEAEQYELLREFLHLLYFKRLLVNARERRVLIIESSFQSIEFRGALAKVLFYHFDVVSVLFAPSDTLALLAVGLWSGLVVDVGYYETSVVPIYEQTAILSAVQFLSLAGRQLHDHVRTQILDSARVRGLGDELSSGDDLPPASVALNDLSDDTVEDISVRCCFVGRHNDTRDAQDIQYPMEGDKFLQISGGLRAHAYDVFFSGDTDGRSVATAILDAISAAPIDCRRTLAENIVPIGGVAMATGFVTRLRDELRALLEGDEYRDRVNVKSVKIRKPVVPANFCTWQGGAIFASLEGLAEHSITKEAYMRDPRLPDWSSVLSIERPTPPDPNDESRWKWTGFRKALSSSTPSRMAAPLASLLTKSDIDLSFNK